MVSLNGVLNLTASYAKRINLGVRIKYSLNTRQCFSTFFFSFKEVLIHKDYSTPYEHHNQAIFIKHND